MKKAPCSNRQRLPRTTIGAAQSHHLLGDVVFIGGTLEQGTPSSLLLVGWIKVGSGAGAFKVSRGNAVDQDGGCEPHGHTPRFKAFKPQEIAHCTRAPPLTPDTPDRAGVGVALAPWVVLGP